MKILYALKPILSVGLIFILLHISGLLDPLKVAAHTVVLNTGLLNVQPDEEIKDEIFNYQFEIKDLQGNKISFEQYKGKVVFINLWATWCGPCKAEMPGIQKLYDKIKNDDIVFVILSLDKDQMQPKVNSYIAQNNFTFPVFVPSGYLSEQLQVRSIPTTLVISKEGKIVAKEVGSKNYDTKQFLEFLEKQAIR